jgi:ATP-dependent DNA ligase
MRQLRRTDRDPIAITGPADLRPMPFGNARPDSIENPICEPLWGGTRVLVHVTGGSVVVRDIEGDEVAVDERLQRGLVTAAGASELVVDGHLVPAPLRDTIGVRVGTGIDMVKTAGDMSRHFLLGGLGVRRRDVIADAEAAAAERSPGGPMAFVAIDLLWLDGEPLLDIPLLERKRILESVLADGELVRRTVAVRQPVAVWHSEWIALGFREVAIKAANGRYTPGEPSRDWAISYIRRR